MNQCQGGPAAGEFMHLHKRPVPSIRLFLDGRSYCEDCYTRIRSVGMRHVGCISFGKLSQTRSRCKLLASGKAAETPISAQKRAKKRNHLEQDTGALLARGSPNKNNNKCRISRNHIRFDAIAGNLCKSASRNVDYGLIWLPQSSLDSSHRT